MSFTDYKVADMSLAEFGRREIELAEAEMPPGEPLGLAPSSPAH